MAFCTTGVLAGVSTTMSRVLDIERRQALLAKSSLFQGLPESLVDDMARGAIGRELEAGELVFRKNDPTDFAALVVEGLIYAIVYGPDGRELILDSAEAGQSIGESALLGAHCHYFSAVAAGAAIVLLLRRCHLLRLMTEPAFIDRVLSLLARRVSRSALALETLCLYSLESRLARYLLDLAERSGDVADGVRVVLPKTQTILAAMLNASRPKINAMLQDWQRSGLIDRMRNELTINDLAELRRRAWSE
ncbi:Crp/Fnr family transcriptional regulator [Dyella terrae]|uniref:CRP-like protein Clp n=3 Tax=Dyella TaxID=231454 RepID=A0A4R0YXX9_9GAMM|nr:Crp/Fnr family transcriptional regulator [Dyella soli]TBR40265.1 Crp/Fnr family transcriptional regulator [Dyella terrae]TCI12154.1 Crp/Fnr family transcriptional regulator [Dyella soli]